MEELSQKRSSLMGLAIILVMICHNSIAALLSHGIWYLITEFSQIGVDIFLFASGFGLCYSWSRDSSYPRFISKRLKKIGIPYLLVVACWILFCSVFKIGGGIRNLLWRYSLVSFFAEGNLSEWFIAGILILYFAFPIIYKVAKCKIRLIITSACLWTLSTICIMGGGKRNCKNNIRSIYSPHSDLYGWRVL